VPERLWLTTECSRSWKLVATALSDSSGKLQTTKAVCDFLEDEYVHELFKAPIAVFSPPDQATNAGFETRTAAIHITPTPNDKYEIKIIKEDASWLSKTADINLVAALRVVVVEFQTRAESHLRTPLSTQDTVNLQEAAGSNGAQASNGLLALGLGPAVDAEAILKEFESDSARRRRLFATYLEERRYYMMSADYIRSIIRYGRLPTFAPVSTSDLGKLYHLHFDALEHRKAFPTLFQAYKAVLERAIEALQTSLSSVTKDEIVLTPEIDAEYNNTMLIEAAHALSVIFQDLDSAGESFAPSGVVMAWFKLMAGYGFLDGLDPVSLPPYPHDTQTYKFAAKREHRRNNQAN
jgi:nuclear pore complex protein Nup188